jgi:hypothetical protein
MAEDNYEDGQDMMGIDFSQLSQGRKGATRRPERNYSDPGTRRKGILFAGTAVLILIIIIAIVLLAGNGSSGKPIAALQKRVKALEENTTRFSAIQTNATRFSSRKKRCGSLFQDWKARSRS